jgi:hypothetical protein
LQLIWIAPEPGWSRSHRPTGSSSAATIRRRIQCVIAASYLLGGVVLAAPGRE